jgi:outer membrane receptor protein involved in Fe transport
MRKRIGLLAAAVLAVGLCADRSAEGAAATGATTRATDLTKRPSTRPVSGNLGTVVVKSDLELAREEIAPSLGATAYTIGPAEILTTPQGEDAPLQQVLLRMPGVVEDSFGQEHVRGEHANLTYRVDGVLLPEPLNGFGQELDTRLIGAVTLIDGSLPAQFGFHTAGIVDVTAKSGASLDHNEISIYGGSKGTFEPSVQLGGTEGKWDYFVAGSMRQDDLGIENPTGDRSAIHDRTDQSKLFTYLSYAVDDSSRVNVMVNGSYSKFQIPDTPGLAPQFTLASGAMANSATVDENQIEQDYYGVVSYVKQADRFSLQASAFYRYGDIHFKPDETGDLVFQGVAGEVDNPFTTAGVQIDGAYALNAQHTVRAGLLGDYTMERSDTDTLVLPTAPASDVPVDILDDSRNHATEAGIYLQDEWKLNPKLTLNYGIRYDRFDANFDNEGQISPRVNLVWKSDEWTTWHAGYARYFVPPPVQYVGPGTLGKFVNTTNAPENSLDGPPKVERSNYFDLGVSRKIGEGWQVNLDGFYKDARNLVDLGQFGSAVILSPFNYRTGTVYGSELSSTYKREKWSMFGNFSWVQTAAHDIDSQQFLIDDSELAYIADHNIRLDHESQYTVSASASYDVTRNDLVYVDILYGSGLRSGFANTAKQPFYVPVNVGYQHVFHGGGLRDDKMRLRFDVINIFDEAYELRDGSGIGVAAPQWGQRRSFYVGLTYEF